MSSLPVHDQRDHRRSRRVPRERAPDGSNNQQNKNILIAVPTLDGGASDAGAVELVRILAHGGYHPIVAAQAGRLVADVTAAGGEFIPLNLATNNPLIMLRNAGVLRTLLRERHCVLIHALGRAAAWSALVASRATRTPLVTSWYKGFREQNAFKRLYNRVMTEGQHIIAVSEQIADLVSDRYTTKKNPIWNRMTVVPVSIDFDRFDAGGVAQGRVDALREDWGVGHNTKIILVTGRILRRKGHHVAVRAAQRLKQHGLKDFLVVFVGEDRGRTHYTGELWDLVLATGTVDVIRMAAPVNDMAAAYAAASVVVSAAVQPEGLQRAILEAQAMARPVIVSDLAAGPDVVLSPPAVPDDRITGLRFAADDDAALAASLLRLFAMPEPLRRAIGARGRKWVLEHFNPETVAEQTLRLYARIIAEGAATAATPDPVSQRN
jgi:glycosyltransferase involved in cell wall biosynthesis